MNETLITPPPEKQGADHDSGESMGGDTGKRTPTPQTRFNRMLLATAAFIVISIFALGDFSSFPPLPEEIKSILGTPPSANMINAALIVYSFSAILLILARMMGGHGNYGGMAHVGYLAAFYGFYHFSGALHENFWAVFAAGITILCLETYHIWIYCMEQIEKEQERAGESRKKRGNG